MSTTVALLGLGEAGSEIARDLVAVGVDVRGYDPRVPSVPGVAPRINEGDAVRDADIVLSVNSAGDALTALTNARPSLRMGTLWVEMNTASPALKVAVAEAAGADARVVDVALMAPVPGNGLRTPMLASGAFAQDFADVFTAFGASVSVIDGPVGTAISRKLLRSVFYKGLAAATVEALRAADAAGCGEWLAENIRAELVRFDGATLDRLVDGTYKHARRRADEMTAATDQLLELGVPARVAPAARDMLIAIRDGTDAPGSSSGR